MTEPNDKPQGEQPNLSGQDQSHQVQQHSNGDSRENNPGRGEQQREQQREPPRDDVCRDYLKNICNRGARCKFYHPPETQARSEEAINFCIDFQNRGCMRDNCRFVHASRDEVERYKQTREVTLPLARAIAAVCNGDTIAGIPVCKEFQSGKCLRGAARCRYWHVNLEEEKDRRLRGGRYGGGGPAAMYVPGMRRPGPPMDDMYPKRPRMDDQRVTDLERKNAELMKEIEVLKRELQREHERYDDLYALFRQQGGGAAANPAGMNKPPGGAAYSYGGGWNPGSMSAWP